jgi:hypothetical protein
MICDLRFTIWLKRAGLALALCSILNPQLSTAFAQGSLTPPGAPAPTMKSLDQIEPRTPISAAPFTISAPGSYYLTTNVTVSSGDAITISANNVTLDLNGFTIASTAATASADSAVLLSGSRTNIAICNGHISSGVTNNGGVYSGSGFGLGVFSPGCFNVRVRDVSVSGCQYDGIYIGYNAYNSTIVESCVVNTAGAYGIVAQSVSKSTAIDCGNTALVATTANDSSGVASGNGAGVYATAANNCYGYCLGPGTGLSANAANNCYGYSSAGTGLSANQAQNCYGVSHGNNGIGLQSDTALNCTGVSTGYGINATGLSATYTATCCVGLNPGEGGIGLAAFIANACHGYTGQPMTAFSVMHNINSF